MIQGIDHLGIAVSDLDAAIALYEQAYGLRCEHIEEVPEQKVRTAFFTLGEVHIELLAATSEDSPIAKFIAKNGEGIHHVALRTDDIHGQLQRARDHGLRLINEQPVAGAGGKDIAFLHPKSTRGVLTELCAPRTAAT